MPRYIDVNKIRIVSDTKDADGDALVSLSDVRKAIEQTPTADVVEVVRCKDCRSWDEGYIDPITNYHLGCCRHFQWQGEEFCDIETRDDDFCSYGERKRHE